MIDYLKRHRIWQIAAVLMVLFVLYWGVFAARRYVSESRVVVDSLLNPSVAGGPDLSALLGGTAASRDILVLRDYLLSADVLKKLDGALQLRDHYSDSYDVFSRLLYKDIAFEWFLRHYRNRVSVEYDDTAGVLVIQAQAYTREKAQAVAAMQLREGERFINQLAQSLAREQVNFAEREVAAAGERMAQARQAMLAYQNAHGLASPGGTVVDISAVAARLEGELSDLQARRSAMEAYLAPRAPELVQVTEQIRAVERQLRAQRGRLAASGNGNTLNKVAEEYDRLVLQATFHQSVYQTALSALERARVDATRTLKKVSVLQTPTAPEFSMEPGRIYYSVVFVLVTLLCAGILQLLAAIIREHRD
jgi:capsular polysaccharide transport system permease protein